MPGFAKSRVPTSGTTHPTVPTRTIQRTDIPLIGPGTTGIGPIITDPTIARTIGPTTIGPTSALPGRCAGVD